MRFRVSFGAALLAGFLPSQPIFAAEPARELALIQVGHAVQRAILASVPVSHPAAGVDVRLAALQQEMRTHAADPKVLAFLERARQAGLAGSPAGAPEGFTRSAGGLWIPGAPSLDHDAAARHLHALSGVRAALAHYKLDEIERMPPDALEALARRLWDNQSAAGPALPPGPPATRKAEAAPPAYGRWGVDMSAMDRLVRPQDDFYRHVNGSWLKTFQIPPDKPHYGFFTKLRDESDAAVRKLIEESNEPKIAALYKSFMDQGAVAARGLAPLAEDLAAIEAVQDARSLSALFARANRDGIDSPVALGVSPDRLAPTRHVASLHQSGLGLPEREYYFNDDAESREARAKYLDYAAALLTQAGEAGAAEKASAVFSLEKALAAHHWKIEENRQAEKTYNPVRTAGLGAAFPGLDWDAFLRAAKVPPEETSVIASQPTYLKGLGELLAKTPLNVWKLYMKVRLLDSAAACLPEPFEKAAFEYSKTFSGVTEQAPRWQRGVRLVNEALGEAVGRLYVVKLFPPSSKQRMLELVENLRAAYAERIAGLPWMGEETKRRAQDKLAKFLPMIGYPDKWIDYSALKIEAGDLFGNIRRSSRFGYDRELARLGRPVDRTEWDMTPQTVNAYYSQQENVIVFPAAILQAPFFNPEADDAVNYGAIGAVIGHEMGHGFDDQGSKSDGNGKLVDWWTEADKQAFKARTARLVGQFDAYEPLPGVKVNGRMTLGENIGDLGGLTVAYRAYRLSLKGKEAPVIDGYTGDQRFFLGWAQVWRSLTREKALRNDLATDVHSPDPYRVNGVVRNMPEFYAAFGVRETDGLYLPPEDRVGIW